MSPFGCEWHLERPQAQQTATNNQFQTFLSLSVCLALNTHCLGAKISDVNHFLTARRAQHQQLTRNNRLYATMKLRYLGTRI